MIITNTVLKLNIKDYGDSLVWLYPHGSIQDRKVEDCFPHINAKHYGPNIAFTGNRISTKSLLLTTTSVWDSTDEFGRKGITLSQGILLEDNITGTGTSDIYIAFEALIRFHKVRYKDLQSLLQYVATQGTAEDSRKLAEEIFTSLGESKAGINFQQFQFLSEYLQSVLQHHHTKIRVSTKFPWSEELGFFSLIGLQATVNDVRSIAGGDIASFEDYQHISVSHDVPGYQYVDLNQRLSSQIEGNNSSENLLFQDGRTLDKLGGDSNNFWHKTIEKAFYIANMPITSTFLILCLGAFLIWSFSRNNNESGSIPANPSRIVEHATPTPSPSATPVLSLTGDTSALDETIAQLYAANKKTRQMALSKLTQDTSSHEVMVPRALTYALNHQDQINGLRNTNAILKRCNPSLLEKNKDAYEKFLTLINNIETKPAAGPRPRGRRISNRGARVPPRTRPSPEPTQPTPQRSPIL
jgi:hypothetical protein